MGWTRALTLVQAAHGRILDRRLFLQAGKHAVGLKSTPDIRQGPVHTLYVVMAGQNESEVTNE